MSKLFLIKQKNNSESKIKNYDSLLHCSGKSNKNHSQLIGLKFNSPISKLWNDTIYNYNKNYYKLLPVYNKNMNKLIKGYFYMYDPILNKLTKKKMSRRIRVRLKRLSKNRVFVNKSEIKHNNSQVDINFNTFNSNYINLMGKIYIKKSKFNKLRVINKKLKLKKKIYFLLNKKIKFQLINEENNDLLVDYFKCRNNITQNILELEKRKINTINYIKRFYGKKIKIFRKLLVKLYYFFFKVMKNNDLYNKHINKNISSILDMLYLYISSKVLKKSKKIYNYKNLITYNKLKFTNPKLSVVKNLLERIFHKNVKVNFVNLKYIYLDSNLLAESLSIRLKNKKGSLLKKIRKSVRKVKLPFINKTSRIEFPYKKHKYFIYDKLNNFNLLLSNIYSNNYNETKRDPINKLLNSLYSNKISNNFNNINNKYIHGIRIEASGRLSKRLIASRSVTKIKILGGLKNRNSSVEGLSCMIVRGNLSSNIQYTKLKSKTRNGSYGLKLSISSN